MFVQIADKQRRAVSVVSTALVGAGIRDRSVSAGFDSWLYPSGHVECFAVFVSGPAGTDIEPYYETGKTFVEAVRKVLATIKGQTNKNGAKPGNPEAAPF